MSQRKYNEDSDIAHSLEADVEYPEKLHEPQNLPERMKIGKIEQLAAKKICFVHKKF